MEAEASSNRLRAWRLASATVALVLIIVLVVLVVTRKRNPDRSNEAFCGRISSVAELSDILAAGDGTQIQSAVQRLNNASRVAPAAIAPSVQVLVDYADGVATSVATAGNERGSVDAALAEAVRERNGDVPAVVAAGQDVQRFTQTACNIDLANLPTESSANSTTP